MFPLVLYPAQIIDFTSSLLLLLLLLCCIVFIGKYVLAQVVGVFFEKETFFILATKKRHDMARVRICY